MNAEGDVVTLIGRYFAGERLEMVAILLGCTLVTLLAALLWSQDRGGFAAGLLTCVVGSSLMLSGTAVALLVRDSRLRSSLVEQVRRGETSTVRLVEAERIRVVIGKYPAYRRAAILIGLAGLACLWIWTRETVAGAVVGLLLLVAGQFIIDHYSERRANAYLTALRAPAFNLQQLP